MNMLMILNLSAKFEPNRRFEYYHLLPGPAWFYHGQTLKWRTTVLAESG